MSGFISSINFLRISTLILTEFIFQEAIIAIYIEKEVPQPHVELALGFVILKYEPIKSFTKSNLDPFRKFNDVGSIKILTSLNLKILSSSLIFLSKLNL